MLDFRRHLYQQAHRNELLQSELELEKARLEALQKDLNEEKRLRHTLVLQTTRELYEKEQIIQSFKSSLSFNLVHGPLKRIPVVSILFTPFIHILLIMVRLRRRFFLPRLGVLRQFPPRKSKLNTRYFQVPRIDRPLPSISIVTPTYNYAMYLERTIKSVVCQNYPALEYIIQDGGSSDGTLELLQKHEPGLFRFSSARDNGQAHAINLGLEHSSGEILAYLNSDDILLPNTLHYVANFFMNNPDVDVVYGHRLCIDEHDDVVGEWILPPHDAEVSRWVDFVPQETMFWRRRIWDAVGGQLDESFHFAMDWDLILRFQDAGAVFKRLPRFLAGFRVHDQQKSIQQAADVGKSEIDRLHLRTFGRKVPLDEISIRIQSFLRSSLYHHHLHKLKMMQDHVIGLVLGQNQPATWYER
jgi:glycosyltransferase involved in cell wall biosynthesis